MLISAFSVGKGKMVNELGKLYEVGTPNMQWESDIGEGWMKQSRSSRNNSPEDSFAGRGLPLGIASQRIRLYFNLSAYIRNNISLVWNMSVESPYGTYVIKSLSLGRVNAIGICSFVLCAAYQRIREPWHDFEASPPTPAFWYVRKLIGSFWHPECAIYF